MIPKQHFLELSEPSNASVSSGDSEVSFQFTLPYMKVKERMTKKEDLKKNFFITD